MPFVEQDGTAFGAVNFSDVSVKVVNSSQIDVTIDGTTTRLTANSNGFVSQDGNLKATYVADTDQIVFVGNLFDPIAGKNYVGTFVDGNRTSIASMPTGGTATYSTGGTVTLDGTLSSGGSYNQGTMSLVADFAAGSIGGTMTGLLAAAPGTVFDLTPTSIIGNGFNTSLTTLNPGVNIFSSAVDGRFFGAGASSVGGTVSLSTNVGNAAGVFTSVP